MDGKPPPPNPNLPYREDCWSDGETAALVEAWGGRYVDLNRGSLRQPQWREVAEAVNSRPGASARRRPPRTDIQCKNRVDTLKKKYKAERARGTPSSWYFYRDLDMLVGPTLSAAGGGGGGGGSGKKPSPPRALPMLRRRLESPSRSPSPPSPTPAVALPLPNYRQASNLPSAGLLFNKIAAAAAAESDSEDGYNNPNNNYDDDEDDGSQQSPSRSVSSRSGGGAAAGGGVSSSKRKRGGGGGFGELARAVETFAEMYERMEFAKQRHAEEMERQRIKFLKDLELKRMQAFVDVQLQLAKAKHRKHPDGASEMLMSLAALPFLSTPAYL
ncbi:hypothetical protein E2562_017840 [Oryza meyeriana var. granulata]|uniref:Myb/SANT-like DNA-binding domain-containing protein n=1 Tax=Oryza meyeriana var. granulata TaxID=110450 RepID=A0A6G1DYE0_9ORYZ|nr:hypothetical protein E2562_017840 [Oryza meyeriana var. granulata]